MSNILFAQEKYGIILVGDKAFGLTDGENKLSDKFPHTSFWSDAFLYWEALRESGFHPNNIYLLYLDGNDETHRYHRYNDVVEFPITHSASSEQAFAELLDNLAFGKNNNPRINEEDFLFITTLGHGNVSDEETYFAITKYDPYSKDTLFETEFDSYLNNIAASKIYISLNQCHSGGFLNSLAKSGRIITTSASEVDSAWETDNKYRTNFIEYWAYETDTIRDTIWEHQEYAMHLVNAFRGSDIVESNFYQTGFGNFELNNADLDNDNAISVFEAFEWMQLFYSTNQTPQYSDMSNVIKTTSLKYPTIINSYINLTDEVLGLACVPSTVNLTSNMTFRGNTEIEFLSAGEIIVNSGKTLEIKDNVRFVTPYSANKIRVYGTLKVTQSQLQNIDVVVEDGGILLVNNDVTLHSSTKLQLEEGSMVAGAGKGNELIIHGDISIDDNVTFSELSYKNVGGLILDNNQSIAIANATFSYSNLIGYFDQDNFSLQNSAITNSFVSVDLVPNQYTGNCAVTGNEFQGAKGIAALTVDGFTMFNIQNNIFRNNSGDGIAIYNSGYVTYPNKTIANNSIGENSNRLAAKAIRLYNTVADISFNTIVDNDYGIAIYHNSSAAIYGTFAGSLNGEYQDIRFNTINQVLAEDVSFPWKFEFNRIENSSHTYPWIYYDPTTQGVVDIENNCWGSIFNPLVDLDPAQSFDYLPMWNCGMKSSGAEEASKGDLQENYESILALIADEKYEAASGQLKSIVSSAPESIYAVEAMKALPSVAQKLNKLNEVILWYNENESIQNSEQLSLIAEYMKAECYIKMVMYSEALAIYDAIIANPPTEDDYNYALIDATRVYQLMNNSGEKGLSFKYSDEISLENIQNNIDRARLLDGMKRSKEADIEVLPKEESQNLALEDVNFTLYPNPAKDKAIIEMNIEVDSNVTIGLYDISGKLIKQDVIQTTSTGKLHYELSTTGIDNGVYFIKSSCNNSQRMDRIIVTK